LKLPGINGWSLWLHKNRQGTVDLQPAKIGRNEILKVKIAQHYIHRQIPHYNLEKVINNFIK